MMRKTWFIEGSVSGTIDQPSIDNGFISKDLSRLWVFTERVNHRSGILLSWWVLACHILGLTPKPKHCQPQQDCTPNHCVRFTLSFQIDIHSIYCSIVPYFKIWKETKCPLRKEWLSKLWATTLGANSLKRTGISDCRRVPDRIQCFMQ